MKQRYSKTVKCLALLNTYYSYMGSDLTDNQTVRDVMSYSSREVERMTGGQIEDIPAKTEEAIKYLNKLFKR